MLEAMRCGVASSPAIAADGTVYITSYSPTTHAQRTGTHLNAITKAGVLKWTLTLTTAKGQTAKVSVGQGWGGPPQRVTVAVAAG